MEQQNGAQEQPFNIVVKGPNGEKVEFAVMPYDAAVSIKERLISYYSFSAYTCYHFEVDMKPGRKIIDLDTCFSEYDFIKEGSIFYLVCDQYNRFAAREHIKHTVALMSDNLPLLGLLLKKQDDEVPECLVEFQKILDAAEEKKDTKEMVLKDQYCDEATIAKDQALKSEISKPSFPIRFNLESFNQTRNLLTEKKELPLVSLHMSAYNPTSATRELMGDLLYLRVVTKESAVYHITSCSSGFFVNQSTDSSFDPAVSTTFPSTYPTLCRLFAALSPLFAEWFAKRVEEGDQIEKITLEDLLSTLHSLPSSNINSQLWFETATEERRDLFAYGDSILTESNIPYLSSDIKSNPNWLMEYINAKTAEEVDLRPYFAVEYENRFAEAATQGVTRIVEEALKPVSSAYDNIYQLDGITYTKLPSGSESTRVNANYSILSTNAINNAAVDHLFTPLVAVVDYKGYRFIAQTPIPGLNERQLNHLMMYGSSDNGKTLFKDERVEPIVQSLASKLKWAESSIRVSTEEPVEIKMNAVAAAPASKPLDTKDGKPVTLLGPVEGKILHGTDGNLYAIEYQRSQPVDSFWLQQLIQKKQEYNSIFYLRPELVAQMTRQCEMAKMQVDSMKEILQKVDAGEKVEEITEDDVKKIREQLPALEENVKLIPTLFDVNAFTPFSARSEQEDEENLAKEKDVIALANYLVGQLLPNLHDELRGLSVNNQDGCKIVQLMHSSGINIRYLGELAKQCLNKSLAETDEVDVLIIRACENEMIARCAKLILNELLSNPTLATASGYTVAAFLNALVKKTRDHEICLEGIRKNKKSKEVARVPEAIANELKTQQVTSEGVWKRIVELVERKFNYTFQIWNQPTEECDHAIVLRRTCILMGIRLESAPYDMNADVIVHPHDIAGYSTHIKYSQTSLFDDSLISMYQQATLLLQGGQLPSAFLTCRAIVIRSVSCCHKLHPVAIRALSMMASILFILKDYVNAVKYHRLTLRCSERVYGVDSIEAAVCHNQLSDALHKAGCLNESILHYKVCLDIYLMACGDHSEDIGATYANLGFLYKELAFNDKAIACLRFAVEKVSKKNPSYLRIVSELVQCYAYSLFVCCEV